MRYLYLGQTSMGNRGCEALIRSNTGLIREIDPAATFLCPSEDIALDRAQWPQAEANGVEFIEVFPFARSLKWWNRLRRWAPPLVSVARPPSYPLNGPLRMALSRVDAVLMTGGDIISLDYDVFSLYHWSGLVEAAARAGKPVHLVAASVGPFTRRPEVEARMRTHLSVYRSVSIRETPSLAYVETMGVGDAALVADPAFTMTPEPWDDGAFFRPGVDTLGLNFSPLVRETRGSEESKQAFDDDIVRFIASVIAETRMDVLLIPHVYPLGDSTDNSDRHYLQGLCRQLSSDDRIRLLPRELNAAQLKHALGKCRYFMGARTHATVGALSQSVPTCSIAYSVKAIGINEDLLGDTRHVLPTPEVSHDTLWSHLRLLIAEEDRIRTLLDERLPEWKLRARAAMPLVGPPGRDA